jgi:hypothetical protein
MKQLLIRPVPMRGESWQGYLLRLTEHNELGTPRRIKPEWLSTPAQASILRGPIAGLGPLNAPDPEGLGPRYWNTRRPRYCPLCLEEQPHWRSLWALVFYVACHRHGLALLDRCAGCAQSLKWSRGDLAHCRCGNDLRRQAAHPASAGAVAVSMSLAMAWRDGARCISAGDASIEDLLYRTWLLGSYRSGAAKRAQKLSDLHVVAEATKIAEAAHEVMHPWPSSFFAFLDEAAIRYGKVQSTRLADRFGALYKELFGSKALTALADLREGFEAYVREKWPGQIAERNRRLSPETRLAHVWIPVTRAAKQMHWRPARLRVLVSRGVIRGHLRPRPSGRVAGVVHKDDLARLNAEARTWLDLGEVCRILHVGKKAVHQMMAGGRLTAVSGPSVDGHPIWQFRRTDVDRLHDGAAAC